MSYREEQRRRLPKRIYWPRILAHGLVCISLLSVFLVESSPPIWVWIALAVYSLAWPHLAYWYSSRNRNPGLAEFRNLYSSAIWHGFWIAALGFNLMPTVMLISILSSESYGGLRSYLRGLVAIAVGVVIGIFTLGFKFTPESSLITMLATAPGLVTFPVVFGLSNFQLRRKLISKTE